MENDECQPGCKDSSRLEAKRVASTYSLRVRTSIAFCNTSVIALIGVDACTSCRKPRQ